MAADADRQRHPEKQAERPAHMAMQSLARFCKARIIWKGGFSKGEGRKPPQARFRPLSIREEGTLHPVRLRRGACCGTACSLMSTGDYQARCERRPKRQFIFGSLKDLRFPGFSSGKRLLKSRA